MGPLRVIFITVLFIQVNSNLENEEPALYYYGLEESERSLPACGARQACSALLQRYWRAPALVRLCRCARRRRCDTRAPVDFRVELNNRAFMQFCEPVTDWPECSINEAPLSIDTTYDQMNPDELEEKHHRGKHLYPPNITLSCHCRTPNYWKLKEDKISSRVYSCASPPPCRSQEHCGHVDAALLALRQHCLCPRRHVCTHSGGLPHVYFRDIVYEGAAWKAYCQPLDDRYDEYDY